MSVPAALHRAVIGSLLAEPISSLAPLPQLESGAATELWILPAQRCIWSSQGTPHGSAEKGRGHIFEALVPNQARGINP
jgi:hypothetical protein